MPLQTPRNNGRTLDRSDENITDEDFYSSLRVGEVAAAEQARTVAQSDRLSPARATEIVSAASALSFPPMLAMRAADQLIGERDRLGLRRRLSEAPLLSSFMGRDPVRAAAVEDSTEQLATLERRLRRYARPTEDINYLKEIGGEVVDVPRGVGAGATSLVGGGLAGAGQVLQAADQIDEATYDLFLRPSLGAWGQAIDEIIPADRQDQISDALFDNNTARALGRSALAARDAFSPVADTLALAGDVTGETLEASGDAVNEFADFLRPDEQGFEDQVYEGLGQILGAVGLSMAGGAGLTTTAFVGQGVEMQAQRLEAAGIDPDTRFDILALGGGFTGLSEQLRLGRILDVMPPSFRNSVFARAMGRFVGPRTARVLGEAFEEVVQEGAEGTAHGFLELTYNEDARIFDGMFEEMSVAGTSAALFQIIMEAAAPGRSRGVRTEVARNLLDRVNEAVEGAPVTQRSRDLVREFVESGTGGDTINLSSEGVQVLYQSGSEGRAALEALGVTDDQIATAIGFGSDVELDVATVVTSEKYDLIADHLRVGAEDHTTSEIRAGVMSDVVAVDIAQAAQDIADRVSREESTGAVAASVEAQLISVGRGQEEASAAGAVWGAVMDGLAVQTGQAPDQIFERLNLSIERGRARAAGKSQRQGPIRLRRPTQSAAVEQFRLQLGSIGYPNPFNESEIVTREGGGLEVSRVPGDGPRTVHLSSLRALQTGGGGRTLRGVTALADLYGIDLQLSAVPFEGGPNARAMSQRELEQWYRGFGFEGDPGGLMTRPASREGSAALNVGLAIGDENAALSPARVREALPEGVEIRGETYLKRDDVETLDEDTLVLQLSRPLTPEELDQMSIDTEQEAIAQMFAQSGTLGGPMAADWGPFNPDFFHMPDGRTASVAVVPRDRDLNQSAVEIKLNSLDLQGSGTGGRILNRDLAEALTKRHMEIYGRSLNPVNNEADYELVKAAMREDLEFQIAGSGDTGVNWYTDDVAEAMSKMELIFPELSNPVKRDLFIAFAAITSPRERPVPNWEKASLMWEQYRVDGTLPTVKPNGKKFGTNSVTSAIRLMEHLVQTRGEDGAVEFMFTAHSGREIAEIRRDSGVFIEKPRLGQYTANETTLKGEYMGSRLFGPKVGDFMLNATGVDPNAITVDIWNHRTWDRLTGQLQSYRDKSEHEAGITNDAPRPGERDTIERMEQELAAERGLEPSSVQALLWYYEQKLFRDHGIYSPSQSFSDGAMAYLKKRIELNGERINEAGREATERAVRRAQSDVASQTFQQERIEQGRAPFHAQQIEAGETKAAWEEFNSTQAKYSLDEIYAVGEDLNAELNDYLARIAQELNLEHAAGPLKKREKSEGKMILKGYPSTGPLADIMRGTLVVDSVDQHQAAIEALAARYDVFDQGWATPDPNGESGYFDAKVIVRFDNGMMGEVQLMPREIADAKKNGGHLIYDELTAILKAKKYDALPSVQERSHAFYTQALEASPYWLAIRDTLAAASGNVRSQTLLSNIRASERIASTSTSVQPSSTEFMTNARFSGNDGSSTSTAGRFSAFSQNLISMFGGVSALEKFEEGPIVYQHDVTFNQQDAQRERVLTGYTGARVRFEKFDRAFLMSGEGLHAFGSGFYTAQSIDVARMYYEAFLKQERQGFRDSRPPQAEGDAGYDLVSDLMAELLDDGGALSGFEQVDARARADNEVVFGYEVEPGNRLEAPDRSLLDRVLDRQSQPHSERIVIDLYKSLDREIRQSDSLSLVSSKMPSNDGIGALKSTWASFDVIDDQGGEFSIRVRATMVENSGRPNVRVTVTPVSPTEYLAGLHETAFPEGPFLDWDKPFSDQPDAVRKAFNDDLRAELQAELDQAKRDHREALDAAAGEIGGAHSEQMFALRDASARVGVAALMLKKFSPDNIENLAGEHLYGLLATRFGGNNQGQYEASEWLSERGVIGNQYLDGFSRSKGKGSYNYVIFDEANIDVVDNTLRQDKVEFTPPPADEDGIIRVNGREYQAREEGEALKPYLKRAIDTMPIPEELPFEPNRFFDLSGEHYMIPMDMLVSTKSDEENQQGASNAPKRFLAAYDGIIPARGPITVRFRPDGKFEIVDGNGTFSAFKEFGWTEIPAEVEALPMPAELEMEQEDDAARASVTIPGQGVLSDREVLVRLSQSADASSFMHESAHIFLEIYSALEGEYAEVAAIMDEVRAWLGAERGVPFTTDQHEMFAESFEAYLLRGKAPAAELKGAFSAFRSWLSKVYRNMRHRLPNLDPQAIQIFDKMLAADGALQHAQEQAPQSLTEAMAGIMTEDEIAKHKKLIERARSEATDHITKKLASKIERLNRREVREAREAIKEEVERRVAGDPVYSVLSLILDEGGQQLDRGAVLEVLTPEEVKRLPRGRRGLLTSEGGVTDLETYAVENGFLSADSMLKRMVGANTPKIEIARLLELEAEKRGVALMTDSQVDAAAVAATFTTGAAEIMENQLKALSRKAAIKGVPLAAIRAQAKKIIENSPMSEVVKPGNNAASARSLSRKALRAAARGDWVEAVRLQQQALMQHELARLGYAARSEVERGMRRVSKYRPNKKVPQSHDVAYIEVLHRIHSLPGNPSAVEEAAKIRDFIDKNELHDLPVMAEVAIGGTVPALRDMSLDQFRQWRDTLLSMGKKARDSESFNRGQYREETDQLIASIQENAGNKHAQTEFGNENEGKRKNFARQWLSELRRLPFLARLLDGGPDETGRFYKFLIQPLREASNRADDGKAKAQEWFQNFFKEHSSRLRFDQSVYSKTLGHDMTGEEVFAILANTGNDGNKARLLSMPSNESEDTTLFKDEAQLQAFIDEMGTPERMNAVQQLWDYIDSYWPQIAELHRRTTGVRPKKVEASAVTAQGQSYRGGYYPLAYDPNTPGADPAAKGTDSAGAATTLYDDAKIKSGVLVRASTRQGHTIERAAGVKRRILLRLDVATRHIDNVIHDLSFREVFTDVWRRLNDKGVEEAITEAIGPNNYDAMRTMVQRIVAGPMIPNGLAERAMRSLRVKGVTALLGLNLRVILTQPLALTQAYAKLGAGRMSSAIGEYVSDIPGTVKFIMESSAFMRQRARTMTRDINEMMRENNMNDPIDKGRAMSLWLMQQVDVYGSAAPTWLAAFRLKQDEGWTDKDAALFADTAVADTQGGGSQMDLSVMQTGNEVSKMFTFMYGYFSSTFNLSVEAVQNIREGKVAKGVSQLAMLHVVQGALAIILMRGLPDDDDDDDQLADDYLKAVAMGTLENAVGSVPMAREVLAAARFGNAQDTSFGRALGETVRTGERGADILVDLYEDGEVEGDKVARFAMGSLRTAGLLTGLPTYQAARTIDAAVLDETPSAYEILVSGRDREDDR